MPMPNSADAMAVMKEHIKKQYFDPEIVKTFRIYGIALAQLDRDELYAVICFLLKAKPGEVVDNSKDGRRIIS